MEGGAAVSFECESAGAAIAKFKAKANLPGNFPPPRPPQGSRCTAHSYHALAAERGEAFARSGPVGFDLPVQCRVVARHLACAAPSPTQEGLITKSLHGTRETLLMLVRMRRSRTTEPIGPLGFSGPHTALRAQLMVSVQLGACSAAKKHPSKPAPRALAQKFRLVRMLYVGRHRTARTRVTPSALRRLEAGWD